jgi:hypothetical protein
MLVSRNFCGEYKRASTSVGGGRSRGGSGSHHDWHPRFAGQSITCRSCRQADGGFASSPSRAYLPALRWRVRQPDRSDRSHPERTQLWLVTTHDESRARVPWFETNCRAKQKHATPVRTGNGMGCVEGFSWRLPGHRRFFHDAHTVERAVHEEEGHQKEPQSEHVAKPAAGFRSQFHRQFHRQ